MSSDPDQIRADIEVTRGNLSRDVNALTETVRPGNIARRQATKVGDAMSSAKEHVMGAAHDAEASGSSAASSVSDAASAAPGRARSATQGNPLAAGLVALGVGWLVGSLLPASKAEQRAASSLEQNAAPLVEEVKQVAKETAQDLQEPAKEAMESVKSTGAEAISTVKDEGSSAASDVADSAKQSKEAVQERRSEGSSI